MTILREALFAATTEKEPKPDRVPGISCSGLFPCPYRMYLTHLGKIWNEDATPQELLNMQDGWDQEDQSVRRLAKAGVKITNRMPWERKVLIGKSRIPGSIDGSVFVRGKERLWEHKAMSTRRFEEFKSSDLETMPGYKAQVNGYMLGKSYDSAVVMAKCKETNDYWDYIEPYDEKFLAPIVEACDKIRLDGYVPEPKQCEYCAVCGVDCFEDVKLDMSWILRVSAPEMEEKFIKGKQLQQVGSMLEDEARSYFIGIKDKEGNIIVPGVIGDKEILLTDKLEIKKLVVHRADASKSLILKEYGQEGLEKTLIYKDSTQYRFKILEET